MTPTISNTKEADEDAIVDEVVARNRCQLHTGGHVRHIPTMNMAMKCKQATLASPSSYQAANQYFSCTKRGTQSTQQHFCPNRTSYMHATQTLKPRSLLIALFHHDRRQVFTSMRSWVALGVCMRTKIVRYGSTTIPRVPS